MPTDGRLRASASDPARLYCLVDPQASGSLVSAVREHFASAPQVTVLVERRGPHSAPPPPDPSRPAVRRSPVAERDAARMLPARLREGAGELRLVQPLAPLRRSHEDAELPELVAKTIALDPEATSELWWRIAARVLARLERCLRQVPDQLAARTVFGRILDELPGYDQARDALPEWLDAVVDRYAQEREASLDA